MMNNAKGDLTILVIALVLLAVLFVGAAKGWI